MNEHSFEGHPEGDWEDRGELSWNEFDWSGFLRRHEREVARFCALYEAHRDLPERLDAVARQMGWDTEDWSAGETWEDGEQPPAGASVDPESDDRDPYTLHRHPVYVVMVGLITQMRTAWTTVVDQRGRNLDAGLVWRYALALGELERQMVLALQSLDMGDLMLAVVHLKHSLSAVNESLKLVPALATAVGRHGDTFGAETLQRFFDVRELALRLMTECREENRREPPEDLT